MWVASVDYRADLPLSKELLAQIAENYRKIRNTIRFMLGNLGDFNPTTDYIGWSMRGQLNRIMTDKYYVIATKLNDAYLNYNFQEVLRQIVPFVVNDLSAFYLDYTKDTLYCDAKDDFERRAVQSTIYDICLGMLVILNPIIPHTTSEAYLTLPYRNHDDVYLEDMPKGSRLKEPRLQENFVIFEGIRAEILKHLELARNAKIIGKSLEAEVNLTLTKEQVSA